MRILFQGDSITDCGRNYADPHNLTGYTLKTAEILGDGYEYVNVAISGDRSENILARYERDVKPWAPDIFTLLIGINDVWRRFDSNYYTTPETYEHNVREALKKLTHDFPKVKIVLIEPFLIAAPDKKHWRGDMGFVQDKLKEIAREFNARYIPMDGLFSKAYAEGTPWQELSADGVHPAEKGNALIAKYLAEEIKSL